MRFPIDIAARAATLAAPLVSKGCGTPPDATIPSPTPTPTPTPGAAYARVLMSTAGRVVVADLSSSGLKTSIDEQITGDPSWMAFAEPNLLYAVDEWSNTTRLFHLDLEANKLELALEKTGSAGVVHLEFNEEGTRMLGAAYGAGTIDVWNVEGGQLELLKTITSDGKLGPNTERQAAAHPHQAILDPSGRFFAVNDLGTDEVLVIDSKDDTFNIINRVRVEPAGCGPRHGAFYPSVGEATHYMVVCEIKNEVVVYSLAYSETTGIDFTLASSISTFDPAAPPKDAAKAAAGELVLAGSDDVYVSNRLTGEATDSIVHFKFDPHASTLRFSQEFSSGGLLPRMMSVSDSGRELLVATQDGPLGVSILQRNYFSGSVTATPSASLPASVFGEKGAGPKYIKQIA